jgi:Possible tRNA binding domain
VFIFRYVSLWPDVCLDFRRRFLSLLSYKFREFGSVTALSILEAANVGVKDEDGDKLRGTFLSDLYEARWFIKP